jgi:hypothetical protein
MFYPLYVVKRRRKNSEKWEYLSGKNWVLKYHLAQRFGKPDAESNAHKHNAQIELVQSNPDDLQIF